MQCDKTCFGRHFETGFNKFYYKYANVFMFSFLSSSCSELTTTLWSSKRKSRESHLALTCSGVPSRSQGTEPVLLFESNFIEKFLWESGFSNFDHVTIFAKRIFIFWPPSWNGTFLECSFCWFMIVLSVDRYGVSFVPEIPTGKYLKMVESKWTPCAPKGVKSNLGTCKC